MSETYSKVLVIRADGSSEIGTGHVMRCWALAQAWLAAGGRVVFVQAASAAFFDSRIGQEGIGRELIEAEPGSAADATASVHLAKTLGADWIVADGYFFTEEWQAGVRTAGLRLLMIDDICGRRRFNADVILNQNLHAQPGDYPGSSGIRSLLGPRFALLRREFCEVPSRTRDFSTTARRILVTMGGSDPLNFTAVVIQAATELPAESEIVVVVGGANRRRAELERLIAALPAGAAVVRLVQSKNMCELMDWADLAISAAGSTTWELCHRGVPALYVVLADNQEPIAAAIEAQGAGVNLGAADRIPASTLAAEVRRLADDRERRRGMAAAGHALVDGAGARRVVAAMRRQFRITIVSDADSWMAEHIPGLVREWEQAGHCVSYVHTPKEIDSGDVAFFLSLTRLVSAAQLARHVHNLVVHASDLPRGRGWSPLTWQILEGRNEIPLTLFEAEEGVDSGEIYQQCHLKFRGDELIDTLRAQMAVATIALCRNFVRDYPFVASEGRKQAGEPTYYPRRRPEDSRLDPTKPLAEQFNLLRVCDPERYPAYFEFAGHRFEIKPVVRQNDAAKQCQTHRT